MSFKEPSFTFGIEEEYHVVEAESGALAPAPRELMAGLEKDLGEQVSPEFLRSQIEVSTLPCRDIREARSQLRLLRHTVADHARRYGLAPLAAGTHPLGRAGDIETTDKERYRSIAHDFQLVARRLVTCGMHVHVGIEDDGLRIDLMNQARYFLPHLLALSTSSPFWEGRDTGLKCYRLAVYDALPRTGLPGRFASWLEYERTVDVLIRSGVIEDATKIWWDLRPSARFPTIEMRLTDVCPDLEDGLAIAALFVCICRMLYRLRRANQSWRTYPLFLLEENRWRAQRYGVEGTLFDFGKGELVPFADLMEELVALSSEHAGALGCEQELQRVRRIVAQGTGADRQLGLYRQLVEAGREPGEALKGVVARLLEETAA